MTVMAKLDHPNIVRALAFRQIGDKLVMALELLEGQTLRSFLSLEERAGVGQAIAIAMQVARALCEAHENDPAIVHRDLKPENVMLLGDGAVKVMDFGIAKVLAAAGNTTTHSVGTLAYMSPEQIDAGEVDQRSDLYCLGLLLYELLAGHPPFESQSPRELLNLQCTAEPPPLPEDVRAALPRGVESLLFELLQKVPEDRPESARAVLATLENFAPAQGANTAPPSRPVRKSRKPRRALPKDPEPAVKANDTVALIEQAIAPRDVSLKKALWIVLGASLIAAAATFAVRVVTTPDAATTSFETRR
jgi:serine/threonine-protein kinase